MKIMKRIKQQKYVFIRNQIEGADDSYDIVVVKWTLDFCFDAIVKFLKRSISFEDAIKYAKENNIVSFDVFECTERYATFKGELWRY